MVPIPPYYRYLSVVGPFPHLHSFDFETPLPYCSLWGKKLGLNSLSLSLSPFSHTSLYIQVTHTQIYIYIYLRNVVDIHFYCHSGWLSYFTFEIV